MCNVLDILDTLVIISFGHCSPLHMCQAARFAPQDGM